MDEIKPPLFASASACWWASLLTSTWCFCRSSMASNRSWSLWMTMPSWIKCVHKGAQMYENVRLCLWMGLCVSVCEYIYEPARSYCAILGEAYILTRTSPSVPFIKQSHYVHARAPPTIPKWNYLRGSLPVSNRDSRYQHWATTMRN